VIDNTITTVLGRKGCGKTSLVQDIVREHPRAVIFDPCGEYGANVGARIVTGFAAAARALAQVSRSPTARWRLALRVDGLEDQLALLRIAWHLERFLLVIEEAGELCTPQYIPPEVSRLIRMGRHHRISQVYVGQRPSTVHRLVTSQSDLLVSFQQHEDRDVAYLRAVIGPAAETVRELPRFAIIAGGPALEKAPRAVRSRLSRRQMSSPLRRPGETSTDGGAQEI
jgi:hypothetical protein